MNYSAMKRIVLVGVLVSACLSPLLVTAGPRNYELIATISRVDLPAKAVYIGSTRYRVDERTVIYLPTGETKAFKDLKYEDLQGRQVGYELGRSEQGVPAINKLWIEE